MGLPWTFTGVAVGQHFEDNLPLATWSKIASDELGFGHYLDPKEIDTTFEYVGLGHGSVTPQSVEAIKPTAASESVILDSTYTGRAMAALIDDVRQGKLSEGDNVVFVHTGGLPIFFEGTEEVSHY